MPAFPRRRLEIIALAQAVSDGIGANVADYPAAVFSTTALDALLTAQATKVSARQQAEADLSAAVLDEAGGIDAIVEATKQILQVAEGVHRNQPVKLALIGWGAPGEAATHAPGQPRSLEAVIQGAGTVILNWKAPAVAASVGKPRFYRIERQIRNLTTNTVTEEFGVWSDQCTSSEITLTEQPRQVEITYRVFAVNAVGDSGASNSVMAVL